MQSNDSQRNIINYLNFDYARCAVPSKLSTKNKAMIACITERINKKLLETGRLSEVDYIMSHSKLYFSAKCMVKDKVCNNISSALTLLEKELEKRNYII